MKLQKLRKTMGCLVLTGSMVFSMPQIIFAAETELMNETETETIQETEALTEKTTEAETEAVTEAPVQDATESESETITETETETPGESETQTEIETETETASESETESESESESESEAESESEKSKKEEKIKDEDKKLKKPKKGEKQEDHSDANANLTTNIIAGNGIYLSQLSDEYGLTFGENFGQIMDEIEEDFRQWLNQPEDFQVSNWQDILAVYVLRTRESSGKKELILNEESRDELEKVFFMMNIRSDSIVANKLTREVDLANEVCPLNIKDYGEIRKLDKKDREFLKKYTSDECKQLCAVITATKGFVRSEVGPEISEERIAIVAAACSLVGKVGYFWGGKSYSIGWDSLWGTPMTVTAAGSQSTGKNRGFGLDCSGFVCWSYYNGLDGTDGGIGNHTTTQWNASEMVDAQEAQPGDMVFYNSPIAGDQNHVGLVIGKNKDGSLLVAHCSSSRNGVVVGEAWSSGFKYVRSPLSLD